MTNYRIEMSEADKEQWKYCPTCGSEMVEEETEEQQTFACAKNWVHLRIFIVDDDEDIKFV